MRFNIKTSWLIVWSFILSAHCIAQEEYDQYGGYKEITNGATGYFSIGQQGDKYYLFTPEGNAYNALGINHFPKVNNATEEDELIQTLKDWGFNAGDYQGPGWVKDKYPYLQGITLVNTSNFFTSSQFAFQDVFDSTYIQQLENTIKNVVESQASNEMLIGYFWTDIPIWGNSKSGSTWISFFKKLDDTSPGKQVWNEWKSLNPSAPENKFLALIAKQIYSNGYDFTKKYDANHLIFGDRYFDIDMPEEVINESLPYVDAVSFQPVGAPLDLNFLKNLYEKYKKPIYIADHASSFATPEYPKTMCQIASDQESYAKFYDNYITSVFSLPYVIGYNKCQYKDLVKPNYLKQGLVQGDGTPYDVVNEVKKSNFDALKIAYGAPIISPRGGLYKGEIEISMTNILSYDTIRYTMDGLDPTTGSAIFEGAFKINITESDTIYVKAQAFKDGEAASPLIEAVYIYKLQPEVESLKVNFSKEIKLTFTQPIDSVTAKDISNYALNNNITVSSIIQSGLNTVILNINEDFQDNKTYDITINNVKGINGNAIEPETKMSFLYSRTWVTASDFEDENLPENTTDEDLNTWWSAKGIGEWIKFDLGETRSVDYVEIAFYKGDEKNSFFSIEVSDDNENWVKIFDGGSSGTTNELEKFTLNPTDTRFVKIIGKGNASSDTAIAQSNIITEVNIHSNEIISGINKVLAPPAFIYPNPLNNDMLNIRLEGYDAHEVNVSIVDLTGRSVYNRQLQATQSEIQVPANKLNKGVYIISVNGSKQKLIVE